MRSALVKKLYPDVPNSSRVHLENWINAAAASLHDPEQLVLDAGSGDSPYRDLFSRFQYESADHNPRDHITHVCDLTSIPVDDDRYDLVLASQVLEHVPDPLAVMREIRRVLKPGGHAWLSAPLFYAEHEQPHDYFRYTQFGWTHMAEAAGMELVSIEWLEGYYGTLSYQLKVASASLPQSMSPLKFAFRHLARWFALKDIAYRKTDVGQPKNYACVMKKP